MTRLFVDRISPGGVSAAEYDFVCLEREDGVVVDVMPAYVRPPFIDHYGDQHELEEPSTTVSAYRDGDRYIVASCAGTMRAGFDHFEPYTGPLPGTAIATKEFKISDNAAFEKMPMYVDFDRTTRVIWAHEGNHTRLHDIAPFSFFFGTRSRGVLMTMIVNSGLVTFGLRHPKGDGPPAVAQSITDSIAAIADDRGEELPVPPPREQRALAAALLRPGARKHVLVDDPALLHELDVERLRRMRRYPDGTKLPPWKLRSLDLEDPYS